MLLSTNHHEQEHTTTILDQRRTKHPGNRENIEQIKTEMHRDTQLYRLRALRKEVGVTQVSLAGKIGVSKTGAPHSG